MSTQKLNRPLCQCDKIINKNKKKYCKKNDINADFSVAKKKNGNTKVNFVSEQSLKELDPYTSSITGFSCLNLDFYNKTLRVYYPSTGTAEIDKVIEFLVGESLELQPWVPEQRKNHSSALSHGLDFLGVKLVEVESYEEADLVVGNVKNYLDVIGYCSLPFELDVYPFLNEKLYIFYSGMYETDATAPGSYWYHAFLHYQGHVLGLAHPETTGSGSRIMPGSGYDDDVKNNNLGLFSMNSVLTTQMSSITQKVPYVSTTDTVEWDSLSYPRTFMTLDLKALRFLYGVDKVNPQYLTWTDTSCSDGVTQLVVSGTEGATLNLKPNPDAYSPVFNLSLDSFSGNPGVDSISSFSLISRSAKSTRGASILDSESHISRVLTDFEELNAQTSFLKNNVEIVISGTNAKKISLYLGGYEKDYKLTEEAHRVEVVNKHNKKTLQVLFNNFKVDINLFFFGRNKIMDYEQVERELNKETIVTTPEPIKPIESPSENQNIGEFIINNLDEEHYNEIVNSFFEVNPRENLSNISDQELVNILNDYAVSFITERFKHKLVGIPLPKMADALRRKK